MQTLVRPTRLFAAAAIVISGLALLVTPSSAGGPPALTGVVECTSPGTFTITWTLEDFLGEDYLFEITAAEMSGAATGSVTFVPTSLNGDGETAVGTALVAGDTTGAVTLDVTFDVTFLPEGEEFTDDSTATVELDGSCEAPPTSPTTESSTTSSSAVAAAAATRPSFTG